MKMIINWIINKILNAQQFVGHFLLGENTLLKYEEQLRKMLNDN